MLQSPPITLYPRTEGVPWHFFAQITVGGTANGVLTASDQDLFKRLVQSTPAGNGGPAATTTNPVLELAVIVRRFGNVELNQASVE